MPPPKPKSLPNTVNVASIKAHDNHKSAGSMKVPTGNSEQRDIKGSSSGRPKVCGLVTFDQLPISPIHRSQERRPRSLNLKKKSRTPLNQVHWMSPRYSRRSMKYRIIYLVFNDIYRFNYVLSIPLPAFYRFLRHLERSLRN